MKPYALETRSDKTFAEFFAGIGLVGEGLTPSGWRCCYANDIDPKKQRLYELGHGAASPFHREDVWNTLAVLERLGPPPFLATASFPCTDLSAAGKQLGFAGQHSSTFFGFARALAALGSSRPPLVVLENVDGLLRVGGGSVFREVVETLRDLDYRLGVYEINASYFLPQSRPRVFVVGVGANVATAVAQAGLHWAPARDLAPNWRRSTTLLRRMLECGAQPWLDGELPAPPPRICELADVLDFGEEQPWWSEPEFQRHWAMLSDRHRTQIEQLVATDERWIGAAFRRMRQGRQMLEVRFDGLAGCLRTPSGGSGRQIVVAIDQARVRMRWMTPREYARLQGAEDFPFGNATDRELLWAFGDAVCVPAIRWLDEKILSLLFEVSRKTGQRSRCKGALASIQLLRGERPPSSTSAARAGQE